jgi:hypothetical protein
VPMLSEVRLSNLSLVPSHERKPISDRELSECDFETWEPVNENGEPVPSTRMIDSICISSRLAYVLMLKSRDELMAMHGQMDINTGDEMMAGLLVTGERLKEMAQMVEAAYFRSLASRTAYAES